MSEFELTRNPQTIADEINAIKKEVEGAIINGAIEIGKRLCEVKAMVAVGSWGQWLKDNIDYSERTAQNMMAVYNEYGKKGVPDGLRNASLTNALAMIGLPEDIRHDLIESGAPEEMSTRELRKRIAELEEEKAKQQVTIDSLMEDVADVSERSAQTEREASEQAERVKKLLEASEREKEELRSGALQANERALQADEQIRRMEADREELLTRLSEAEARKATVMEPAVIEKDSVETLEKLRRLEEELSEARGKAATAKAESEGMVLFRAAWDRFVHVFRECAELIDRVERDDGPDKARRLRDALAASARKMAAQAEGKA